MAIAFDGPNKLITLSAGTTSLNVKDLWSRWVDWFLTDDNSKYDIWMMQVGGDDIDESQGTAIPIYIFLASGVKIKPQEADHTLTVTDAILVVAGGGDPFQDTDGDYTVRINYQQPVQAITVATGSGLSDEQEEMMMELQERSAFLLKTIRNKRELVKADDGWFLVAYDDDGYTEILRKRLKDKDGNDITDLAAGVFGKELASSV